MHGNIIWIVWVNGLSAQISVGVRRCMLENSAIREVTCCKDDRLKIENNFCQYIFFLLSYLKFMLPLKTLEQNIICMNRVRVKVV